MEAPPCKSRASCIDSQVDLIETVRDTNGIGEVGGMAKSLMVGLAASLAFVALLLTTFAVGDVSDTTWNGLGLLTVTAALVALGSFIRHLTMRRQTIPGDQGRY